MIRTTRTTYVFAGGFILFALAGCTIKVQEADTPSNPPLPNDGSSGSAGDGGSSPVDGAGGSTGIGDSGGAGGGGTETVPPGNGGVSPVVEAVFSDTTVSDATSFAGDGFAAKRAALPELYPEVSELIAGGPAEAEAMLDKFASAPTADKDDNLFVLAYALEQMDYTQGVDRLVAFLEENMTEEVTHSISAVTHAVRSMTGQPLDDSAAYLASEIEATIAVLGGTNQKATVNNKGSRKTCWKEFIFLDDNGNELRYAANHGDPNKAGQLIKVGGNLHSRNSIPLERAQRIFQDVVSGGGTYVDGGTTFQGQPTNQLNCAGYVFRDANDAQQWTGYPDRWYEALRASGAMEPVSLPSFNAEPGDIVFYFGRGGGSLPAHVAEVKERSSGFFSEGITVRNADGPTGLFDANIEARFFGDRYDLGRTEVWRLKNGRLPRMKANTDRSQANSCHGDDTNDDGYPDSDTCPVNFRCIDPEFVLGLRGACCQSDGACTQATQDVCAATPGATYQGDGTDCDEEDCSPPVELMVWYTSNVCCWGAPHIQITTRDVFEEPGLRSSWPGGGTDPVVPVTKTELQGGFATVQEAQAWLCPQFTSWTFHRWCGSHIQGPLGGNWQGTAGCSYDPPLPQADAAPEFNGCPQ